MSLNASSGHVATLPAPIFKLLTEREEGLLRSLALQRAIRQVRARQLALNTRREVERPHEFPIYCMGMEDVEDRYLLCGYANGALAIIDVEDRATSSWSQLKAIVKIPPGSHKFGVTGLAWYPTDTGMFITASFDKTVKVWDTNLAKHVFTFDMPDKLYTMSMPCSAVRHTLIAVGGADQRVYLCDIRSGSKQQTLEGHVGAVLSLAWSMRDDFVLASGGNDGTLRLWDARKSRSCLAILRRHEGPGDHSAGHGASAPVEGEATGRAIAHEGGVRSLLYAQGGRQLLSSGCDGRVRLWNPDSGRNLVVNFGPFPRAAAAAGSGGWRGGYMSVQMAATWGGGGGGIVYHPRGKEVVACCIETGQRLGTLSGHQDGVTCCAAQGGSDNLLTAGRDGNILLWSPPSALHAADAHDLAAAEPFGRDAWSDSD